MNCYVLEYYDQAISIPLEYESASAKRLAVMHTPDYFVIHRTSAGWQECKHEREFEKLAQGSPTPLRNVVRNPGAVAETSYSPGFKDGSR